MDRPLSLLLVEDSEADVELVVAELRRHGYDLEFTRVDSEEGLREALAFGGWDIVLCDHNLPSLDSATALAVVLERGRDLPVIILSGTIGEEAAVEALKAGAKDVVLKSHLARVGPVIDQALEEAERHRERLRVEEQLRQSQKMEAIGSLAAGIAHDFNNLLLVIRGYSAILLKNLDDEKLRGNVLQIDNAAQRAADFTRQLLAFSRQQVLHPELIDPNGVVQETIALVRRMLGEDIELECELEPQLDSILVDRSQLGQVILNLVVNARDAMEDGGRLSVRTANVELDGAYASDHLGVVPGRYVLLQVTDSGPGMDEETRSRAFDPFFTTKEVGTGLGLATVHGIVKQSGGHIWLYSEPGMGTTFKVYFPIAGKSAVPAAPPSEIGSLHGTETILLVEDAELVRDLVAQALESFGYSVLVAAGGPEAIALAEQHQGTIDLLLTDVVMPQMNGRELSERLLAEYPGLKVLFTSGYPADTIIRHGIEEARAAFIEKPYVPDELARKIREVL